MNTPFPTLVADLPAQEFKALLALVVESERIVLDDRYTTKTSLELSRYLDVLNGKMTLDEFRDLCPRPFTWKALRELSIGTVAACCYIRAFREAGYAV